MARGALRERQCPEIAATTSRKCGGTISLLCTCRLTSLLGFRLKADARLCCCSRRRGRPCWDSAQGAVPCLPSPGLSSPGLFPQHPPVAVEFPVPPSPGSVSAALLPPCPSSPARPYHPEPLFTNSTTALSETTRQRPCHTLASLQGPTHECGSHASAWWQVAIYSFVWERSPAAHGRL